MIKQALAQGDISYLNRLFDTYVVLKDEKEIIKVGIKMIQKADKLNSKERLITIMDRIYEIISKQRSVYRNVFYMEENELKVGNKKKMRNLREYREILSKSISDMLKKIIKELKKGVQSVNNHSKEMEIFLQLNLADFTRYLCEVTYFPSHREEHIKETEIAYKKYFILADEINLNVVNPSSLTAIYHYALFQHEILNRKEQAIKYLKEKKDIIVDSLDVSYKLFVDSYPLMDLISDTLTHWTIIENSGTEESAPINVHSRATTMGPSSTVVLDVRLTTENRDKDRDKDKDKE